MRLSVLERGRLLLLNPQPPAAVSDTGNSCVTTHIYLNIGFTSRQS
jgi:hypothetical protein